MSFSVTVDNIMQYVTFLNITISTASSVYTYMAYFIVSHSYAYIDMIKWKRNLT